MPDTLWHVPDGHHGVEIGLRLGRCAPADQYLAAAAAQTLDAGLGGGGEHVVGDALLAELLR